MTKPANLCAILLLAGLLPPMPVWAADDAPPTAAELLSRGSEDPQEWYAAARGAREANDLDGARQALAEAEKHGLAPVRASFERARIGVSAGDRPAAIAELKALADNGFSAVTAITGDPVLSTMAGEPGYDSIIEAMSVHAFPCDNDDRFHEFDFWLGEWDVHLADGTLAGHNRISAQERGCVLLEEWKSASGGTGMSINFFDAAAEKWVQVWNSADGGQIDIRGGMTDEGMLLTGQLHDVDSKTTLPFRGLWTLMQDGRVRQFFEQSNDGGKTWTPWFEGFYSRSEDAD